MRILIIGSLALLLCGALMMAPQSGPWLSAIVLPISGAGFLWGPVAAWAVAAFGSLVALGFWLSNPPTGWLAGSWTSFGLVPFLLWRKAGHLQSERSRFEEQQRLFRERLRGLQQEQEKRRSAIEEKEGTIQGIVELYGLSKKFLGTLDLDEVIQISEETLSRELPFLKTEQIGEYLKYVRSLVNQGKISVEVLAQALPSAVQDPRSKDRWGIVSGQLALGLQRVSLYHQVQESAIHDGLTGLLVRRHFLERLEEEVQRSVRRSSCLVFLMVDLDHFKGINDTYGHLVGDVVLREVARLIRGSVREIDLVGRFGGEEFSVALPDADRALGLQIADRIRKTIEGTVIHAYDEQIRVTVSVGVSLCPQDAQTMDPLIEQADRAMYQAKEMGRNRAVAVSG